MHYRNFSRFFSFFFIFLWWQGGAWGVTLERGTSEAVVPENSPTIVLAYLIEVVNQKDGEVRVSTDSGVSWQVVGKVLYPTKMINEKGYTASKWVSAAEVGATAVNAIHLVFGYNAAEEKGRVLSLLPKEQLQPPDYYRSYLSKDASIYTDIPAGSAIFGGRWAPFVGNRISVLRKGKIVFPVDKDVMKIKEYVPEEGDVLRIHVYHPEPFPESITFENRFGGFITIQYPGREPKVIGEVLKPVFGVGRFQGTAYAATGRIRANHAGVIDISTSRFGETGGFQIIPANHGMSSEMGSARYLTQWMVIGPTSVFENSLEGIAPFFRYFIQPRYEVWDLGLTYEEWQRRLATRYLVEVRKQGSERWEPMPVVELDPDVRKPLPDWANRVFGNITHVRILFPVGLNPEEGVYDDASPIK